MKVKPAFDLIPTKRYLYCNTQVQQNLSNYALQAMP